MLQTLHDLEFLEDISHFIALDALLFVHVFHRIHLLGVILLNDADLTGQIGVRKWFGRGQIIVMSDSTIRVRQRGLEALSLANSPMLKLVLTSD